MNYITVALAKGRLAGLVMERLSKIGITCGEMSVVKSRKLIFTNEEHKLRFFLAKASDVPTYVEYGAADLGIAGKDTVMEERRDVYEIADLGLGRCRIVAAGNGDILPAFLKSNNLRVATKYPNIAKDYFYLKKHQTVEIIKLNGSVELGAIAGLADVIVDIVETGSTLKENGLVVFDEICAVSARLIANKVSMKLENGRIAELLRKLKDLEKTE